ncbi:MAG: glycosyltransferase family 9 protein [Chloroherpetonaceae bacterium]|nr:glycosyltransferase family 9 protein [Chloroherpetonaceae bacterium]
MAGESLIKKIELSIRKISIRALKALFHKEKLQDKLPIDFQNAKVLFLRQNQIGDALISAPIFKALKEAYPNIHLDVLLDRRNQFVYNTNPYVRKKWVIKLHRFDFFSTLKAIRKEKYDVVIDLIHSASSTSTIFTIFSKARYSVGFIRENDFIYNHAYALNPQKRMMAQLAAVLTSFQLNPDKIHLEPYFVLTPLSKDFAQKEMTRVRLKEGHYPILIINLSSSRKEKFWGKANFIALIQSLRTRTHQYAIAIVSSKGDREIAEEICNATKAFLFSETSRFEEFAALISNASLLITPDSAASHLGDGFQVPTLILTHLSKGNTEWYPSKAKHLVIHSSGGDVKSITLSEVISALSTLEQNASGNYIT